MSYFVLLFALNFKNNAGSNYEAGVYSAYMRSIVEDYDLNIINNVRKNLAWVVSSNYNYPDMHDYGASILWAPYYLLAQKINSWLNLSPIQTLKKDEFVSYDLVCILILNVLFGLYGLKLFKNIVNNYYKIKFPNLLILAIVFSTGFFNFLIYQFDSADISLFFYVACCVYLFSNLSENTTSTEHFLMGSLMAFGSVVKISFPMLYPVFIFLYFRNVKNYSVKNLLFLVLGGTVVFLLKNINDDIKFGLVNLLQGYEYSYSWQHFLSPIPQWRSFVGPAGVFLTAPSILLATIAFMYLIIQAAFKKRLPNSDISFFLVLSASLITKQILSFLSLFEGCTGFGSRQYIIDTGAVISLLALIYKNRNAYYNFYRIVKIYLVAAVLTTSVLFLWWLEVDSYRIPAFNAYYIQNFKVVLDQFNEIINNIYETIASPERFLQNIKYLTLLIPAVFLWQILDYLFKSKKNSQLIKYFGSYIVLIHVSVFLLNVANNKSNVQKMQSAHYFENTVVGNGANIFLYDEYLSELAYAMDISKYDHDRASFEYQKSILLSLIEKTKKEIVRDPIGLLPILNSGNLKEVAIENHDTPVVTILDYNAPIRFKIWQQTK